MKLVLLALIASVTLCHSSEAQILSDFVPSPMRRHGFENKLIPKVDHEEPQVNLNYSFCPFQW